MMLVDHLQLLCKRLNETYGVKMMRMSVLSRLSFIGLSATAVKNVLRKAFMFSVFASITACTPVTTNVESYSDLPENHVGKTVFVTGTKGQDLNSLPSKKAFSLLKAELEAVGLKVSQSSKKADYIAYFGYGIDKGELVTTQYSIPTFGVTGYSGATTYGSVYGSSYSSTTTLTPTYGVTGSTTGSSTSKVFTRSAMLYFVDRRKNKIVFESTASSRGGCHSFTPVAPYIIRSMLTDFPNGKVGTVQLQTEKDYEC